MKKKARRKVFSSDFPLSTPVDVLAAPALLLEVEAIAMLGGGA